LTGVLVKSTIVFHHSWLPLASNREPWTLETYYCIFYCKSR